MLAPGGVTAYQGAAAAAPDALREFMKVRPLDNPADVIIDTVAFRGADMAAAWAARRKQQHMQPESSASALAALAATSAAAAEQVTYRHAAPLRQFWLFHARAVQKILATYSFLLLELLIILIMGLILGQALRGFAPRANYVGDYIRVSPQFIATYLPQVMMYCHMSLSLAGAVAGARTFGLEKIRFGREADAGLSITAYFGAVALASLYRITVCASLFAGTTHFLGKWPLDFWPYFANWLLVYINVNAIGSIVSLITETATASTTASTLGLAYAIFNGFLPSVPRGLLYLSFCYWSSQQLYVGYYSLVENFSAPPYDQFHYDRGTTDATGFGVLFAMTIIYNIIVWALLMFFFRKRN